MYYKSKIIWAEHMAYLLLLGQPVSQNIAQPEQNQEPLNELQYDDTDSM